MALPPAMKARPVHRPDCRLMGARPHREAAAFSSRSPSSGISMRNAKAVTFDRPGMETRMSNLALRPSSEAIRVMMA
ncbi:hypothetical protein D3C87_1819950 [compost metagenome]